MEQKASYSKKDEFCNAIHMRSFPELSKDQFGFFNDFCKKMKLDPELKHVHPVIRGGKLCLQTSIDGLRVLAERTGSYSPGKEPSFQYSEKEVLISATAYIKKRTEDGVWHEIAAIAFYEEFKQDSGPFWRKMPRLMLAKCAESLCLRKAFPLELSSIYIDEEMIEEENSKQRVSKGALKDIEKLSDSQIENIKNLINYDATLSEKILKEIRLKSFSDVPAHGYDFVVRKIQKHLDERRAS